MPLKLIHLTRSIVSSDIFKISCSQNLCNFVPSGRQILDRKFSTTLTRTYSSNKNTDNMRFIQFQRNQNSNTLLGVISNDGSKFVDISSVYPSDMIEFIKANVPISDIEKQIESLKWEEVRSVKLLAPVRNPEKIVCIGLNYLGHCLEQNKEPPSEPMFFSKFASTITGPTDDVIHHDITTVSIFEKKKVISFVYGLSFDFMSTPSDSAKNYHFDNFNFLSFAQIKFHFLRY